MNIPDGILCSKTHEWVTQNDNEAVIGLTDWAVEQLGDIVFIELPDVNTEFSKNEVFATVESVKAASEIYMPISGTIVEVNDNISTTPELLNEDPHGNGWLVKIESEADDTEFADLLDYAD